MICMALLPCALASGAGEEAAAREPLEAYLRGHAMASAEEMDRAFHPQARIQGVRADGSFADWSLEEYKKGFTGKRAPDEDKRKRSIDFIDIRGDAAVARVTLDYPAARFTDYFLLLRRDGRWVIMNKVFHVQKK